MRLIDKFEKFLDKSADQVGGYKPFGCGGSNHWLSFGVAIILSFQYKINLDCIGLSFHHNFNCHIIKSLIY